MHREALTHQQKRWRRRVFAITWLAYAGFYLCRKNFAVVMPLLAEDLGYSKMDFATVIFSYSLLYALGQFGNGLLSDRFGARLVVGVGLTLSILSNLFMGIAVSLALFTVLACVNGVGQSSGWPGLVKTMAHWFGRRERGVVMGWWGTNYVLGGSFATVFATFWVVHPWLFLDWGWRRGFWLPAWLLAIVTLLFVRLVRNRPSEAGIAEIVEESEEGRPSSPSAEASGKPASSVSVLPRVVSQPAVWAIASMYFFLKMTRYSFLFWLPLYMTEEFGYSVSEAGYTSALYELVGFSGAILAGYASDKLARSRRFPVGTVMLLGLALVCFLHPVMTAAGGLGLAVWIVLVGIMTYGPDTLMSGAAAQDLGSPAGSATTAGLINGVGSVGQLCSPLLVAFVSDRYGWNALFYLFVLIALLGAALLATQWSYQPDRRLMEKTDGVRA